MVPLAVQSKIEHSIPYFKTTLEAEAEADIHSLPDSTTRWLSWFGSSHPTRVTQTQ